MAFKINNSNKPQPIPAGPLFTEKMLPNGRVVWVTVPQPDKLMFTVPISKHLFGIGVPHDTTVADYASKLGWYLRTGHDVGIWAGGWAQPHMWRSASLALGPEKSHVLFQRLMVKGSPHLRIDCNPRKLGPAGFADLKTVLGLEISHEEVVAHAKVTRLDLAVDVVRMHVSELVLHHKKQGKRVLYVAPDGRLETIYIHRLRKPPKLDDHGVPIPVTPRARMPRFRVYDVVRQHVDHGLPPPFGTAEVTRIEAVIARPRRTLANIQTVADPFKDLRAGFIGSQAANEVAVSAYLTARRSSGRAEAIGLLGFGTDSTASLDKAEAVGVADIISTGIWDGFALGLQLCGLHDFLAQS